MYNKLFAFLLVLVLMTSCSSFKKAGSLVSPGSSREMLDDNTFKLTELADDASYGLTQENPVKVGGVGTGPLNALLGPGGQTITYNRTGSCCEFATPNGLMGGGLLDKYEVSYDGLDKPVIIFINMYDAGELKAPKGFTFKK